MDVKFKVTELFKLLDIEYRGFGFKLNSKTNTFYTTNSGVFWMVDYEFPDYIIYKPVLISKQRKIIEILNIVFPSSPAVVTQISQGYNLANEFGFGRDYIRLIDQDTGRDKGSSYKVSPKTRIDKIVEDHLHYMRIIGLPFLEALSGLQGVHDFINSKILEGNVDFFLSKERQKEIKKFISKREILSGLIASYLLNTTNREEIIHRIRIKYEDKGPVVRDMNEIILYFENMKQIASFNPN